MFDTIAAISTPRGEGGIGIIRISGDESLEILEKIFKPKNKAKIKDLNNFSINYGHIYNNNKLIDEVLVSIMKSPNTYTKEDIVEINCHGGFLITEKILEIVLSKGAKLAKQGEFTRRAFLNGRIDLTQAEAVMDLINAKTEKGIDISLDQLRGDLKSKIKELKKLLLDVSAHVNVIIDYPEEGIDEPLTEELKENLHHVYKKTDILIKSYDKGKKIKNGIKTVIIGKPNVGKSSLLNALLREERAIVTHVPGTTRDSIEEVINIDGIPLLIGDTAGIRETKDLVENIGVQKSKEMVKKADLILFVVDNSKKITKEDREIYKTIKNKNVIGILNKIDLEDNINLENFGDIKNWIEVSAKNKQGIEKLEDDIYKYLINNEIENISDDIIITNVRHKAALEKTKESIENIFDTINKEMPLDLIAIDLKEALDSLSEITGEISSEDILDHIFKNFCVGK
ncbi:MAG: tRNA uridine-5-carboxymethylaminomethyl(34) synthesis GTPase MnmE [Fusobacteriota bacterium]